MKLATFVYQSKESFGLVCPEGICDVPTLWPTGPKSVLEALQGGEEVLKQLAGLPKRCAKFLPLDHVKLKAPIPNPPKVIGVAVNYVEHHREWDRGYDIPDNPKHRISPRPFIMPATTVIGDGDEIAWPSYSRQIDYELELAAVIGSPCKCVTPQEARRHVAGYTIANDVSARSCTFAEGRLARPKDDFFDWLNGKWADGFCPTGPWLVTADEIGDPCNLEMELTVNGEVRQKANTRLMIHDVYELVSFISQLMTLLPGDIIATGTPAGVAMATGKWLKGGDVIVCRIEKIGLLTNALGQPPREFYSPFVKK